VFRRVISVPPEGVSAQVELVCIGNGPGPCSYEPLVSDDLADQIGVGEAPAKEPGEEGDTRSFDGGSWRLPFDEVMFEYHSVAWSGSAA
jgi:hypothetical protein